MAGGSGKLLGKSFPARWCDIFTDRDASIRGKCKIVAGLIPIDQSVINGEKDEFQTVRDS